MRVLVALALVATLALTVSLTPERAAATHSPRVEPLDLVVEGEPATGLVAFPDGPPTMLVVITRGYTHSAASHAVHLEQLAARGAIAVAMDYRGPQDGFPLAKGAADTKAATVHLLASHPVDTVVLFSVSMGAAVGGMVLADMPGVFDWWVVSEGLSMLHETWAGARALGHPAGLAIEAETGGTPVDVPAAYAARSAALRAHEIVGLQGAVLIHGVNDGLVPHNHGREHAAALRAVGIPTDFYTVLRGTPGQEGTTLTGYAGQNVDGMAGHGTESNDAHTLTAVSIDLLYRLVEGDATVLPSQREFIVDRDAGALP